MSSIFYLVKTRIINALRQWIKHPASIVLFIFILVGLSAAFFAPSAQSDFSASTSELVHRLVRIGVFLLFAIVTVTSISRGLNRGSTLFDMPDVLFLFTSPLRPQTILIYGVLRQAGTVFFASIFLISQIPNFRNNLQLDSKSIIAIFVGWFLMVFSGQILTVGLYSLTASAPKWRKRCRILLFSLVGAIGIGLLLFLAMKGSTLDNVMDYLSHPALHLFPVAGWSAGFVLSVMDGEYVRAVLFLFVTVLCPVLTMIRVQKSESDYYEDVLQATETTYLAKQATKESARSGAAIINYRRVKTGKTGIVGKGDGASAFFYRHLTEQRRTGFLVLDKISVLMIFLSLVAGMILRNQDLPQGLPVLLTEAISFAVLAYLLYFLVIYGKFSQELNKPYIYMVPSGGFWKLLFANMSILLKSWIESFLSFSILAVFAGLSPWFPFLASLCYAVLALLFACTMILTKRLFRLQNQIFSALAYMLCSAILLAPGIGLFVTFLAIFANTAMRLSFIAYIMTLVYGISVSCLVLFACQGILSEYSQV